MYYVITSGESGISIYECETTEDLKEHIEPDEDDEYYHGYPPIFMTDTPCISDGYFIEKEGSMLIIKGEIIIPKPSNIVKTYKID